MFVLLRVASHVEVLWLHSCCHKWQYFRLILRLNNTLFYIYIYIPHSLYPLLHQWILQCFHFLLTGNNAVMNTRGQVFLWGPYFVDFEYISRSRIAESNPSSVFNFLKNLCTDLHRDGAISHSYRPCLGLQFLHTASPQFCPHLPLKNCHSNR